MGKRKIGLEQRGSEVFLGAPRTRPDHVVCPVSCALFLTIGISWGGGYPLVKIAEFIRVFNVEYGPGQASSAFRPKK